MPQSTADSRQLVTEQIPRLRRYARALCGDPGQADDLVQACLERALERLDRWQPGSDMRAWLFTIMHNLFINDMRRRKREREVISEADPEAVEIRHGPADRAGEGLRMRDLERGLALLPPDQREVIVLVGMEQMGYKEVAELTGSPIGTVMSRLNRARRKLKNYLETGSTTNLHRAK